MALKLKKNLRKIPANVLKKLDGIGEKNVVVSSCGIKIKAASIIDGYLKYPGRALNRGLPPFLPVFETILDIAKE